MAYIPSGTNQLVTPDTQLYKKLDAFLAQKTITDADRSSFIPFVFDDHLNKLTICIMFHRSWSDEEEKVFDNVGYLLLVPNYWLSVPKPIAMEYFISILNAFYENEVSTWPNASGGSGDTNPSITCPCCRVP